MVQNKVRNTHIVVTLCLQLQRVMNCSVLDPEESLYFLALSSKSLAYRSWRIIKGKSQQEQVWNTPLLENLHPESHQQSTPAHWVDDVVHPQNDAWFLSVARRVLSHHLFSSVSLSFSSTLSSLSPHLLIFLGCQYDNIQNSLCHC